MGGSGTGGSGTGGTGGSSGSGKSVACGSSNCSLPSKFCCHHNNQPAVCQAAGTTCTYGVPLSCDGPEDCASGQVCCATLFIQGQNENYVSTACASSCTGKDYRVVCGASGTCPSGQTCSTSDLLPPYRDCR